MKLPVDIPSLLTAALDIEKARAVPVSVNILVDESASPEFQVFVRAGFNSESPNSRVMVSYFPTQTPDPAVPSDLCVIAAGHDPRIGQIARSFRDAGTPVLVVAEHGAEVRAHAEAAGAPLPEGDVLSSRVGQPFDEEFLGTLADDIGSWIVESAAEEKRLALSIAYPFVRRPLANQAVQQTSWQNAGVGVVVFVPGADMPLMTANQAKMVLQIAAAYGQPLSPDRVKELAAVFLNGFVWRSAARQLAGVVPAVGWAVKGAMGFAGTQAIGRAAIQYFEAGGNIEGLAAVVNKAFSAAVAAAEAVHSQPSIRAAAQAAAHVVRHTVAQVLDAAAPVAQSAARTVWRSVCPGRRGQGKHAWGVLFAKSPGQH